MKLVKSIVDEIPEEIYEVVSELGVPDHLEGYNFIAHACYILVNDPNKILRVNYDVYPVVATEFGRKRSSVERCIRHAISYVFDNTDYEILEKYFGNTISMYKGNVTSSQFLYTASRIARRRIVKSNE